MGLFGSGGSKSWRGYDGEDKLTEADKLQRAGEAARASIFGDPNTYSPDEDGISTGGCYNGDYPESWHEKCNERLKSDEYYEAETSAKIRDLRQGSD